MSSHPPGKRCTRVKLVKLRLSWTSSLLWVCAGPLCIFGPTVQSVFFCHVPSTELIYLYVHLCYAVLLMIRNTVFFIISLPALPHSCPVSLEPPHEHISELLFYELEKKALITWRGLFKIFSRPYSAITCSPTRHCVPPVFEDPKAVRNSCIPLRVPPVGHTWMDVNAKPSEFPCTSSELALCGQAL